MDDQGLAASLHSTDPVVRAAAATVDVILESLLRVDLGMDERGFISALVSLWGEEMAVARLVEGSRERCWCVGTLNPELVSQLKIGELSETVKAEIERLGVRENLRVDGTEIDGGTSIWTLSPSWGFFRPRYQLRPSRGRLEFYDCNVAGRAFSAIAEIPGKASFTALQCATEHADSNVIEIAIRSLAKRGDPGLAVRLLAELKSTTSEKFVDMAVEALGTLQAPEAALLVNDLLITTDGEFSDVHPVWGPCPHSPGWAEGIHRTLVKLNADNDIQHALDTALSSGALVPKVAALEEVARWFAEAGLGPERDEAWRTPERLERLLCLALRDSTQSVRTAAVGALGKLKSEVVKKSMVDALADNSLEIQVAAGEALIRAEAPELYGRVAEVMLQIVKADQAQDLRRRAGNVLGAIPGGVEPLHAPIQAELVGDQAETALQMIAATLEILPEDVDLFWWRGHALRSLGRLNDAADSYQHAFELEKQASVIPQAIAQTFLDLHDYPRAMEAARQAVEIAPGDADAQSVLAWSSYNAGTIQDAVTAASKAVDLDPVHNSAIWVVLLGHIRQANLGESRSAFQHALRVRQLLSPDPDTSFVTTFLKELQGIKGDNAEISRLIEEINSALKGDVEPRY
jgi:tetratricopeptide (TPR) repeat protein